MLSWLCEILSEPSDRAFMEELYQTYETLMYATARKYLPPEDSADAVQDGVERLIGKIETLRHLEKPALIRYIGLTVQTAAIDLWRRKTAHPAALSLEEGTVGENPDCDLEELLCGKERMEAFRAAWRKLEEKDRLLLQQKYFLELSDEELAGSYGCKPDSIRMKLTRARRRLGHLMQREEVTL